LASYGYRRPLRANTNNGTNAINIPRMINGVAIPDEIRLEDSNMIPATSMAMPTKAIAIGRALLRRGLSAFMGHLHSN
jgi:hypothetical protein